MKAILYSTLAGWISRLFAVLLNIVGMPIALQSLGSSTFSLLLMVLSVGSWIGFANIGIGRTLASVISTRQRQDSQFVVEVVSTATVLAAVINAGLLICGISALYIVMLALGPSAHIFSQDNAFFWPTIAIFVGMCLWFFLSVFEGVDAGRHQLHRLYLFQALSYVISFSTLVTIFPRHPSFLLAIYLLSMGFMLGTILHAVDVVRRYPELFRWNFRWRRGTVQLLMRGTLDFTLISVGLGVLFQLPTGLFGFIAGPSAVLEVGIFLRLIQSYGSLLIAFTYPLSNLIGARLTIQANREAVAVMKISGLLLATGSVVAGIVFFYFSSQLMFVWLRVPLHLDNVFRAGASSMIVFAAFQFFLTALLIAAGATRYVAMTHLIQAIAFVPVSCVAFFSLGQGGILVAIAALLAAGVLVMAVRLSRHPILGLSSWISPQSKSDRPHLQ